jgi:rhodanese-related sulfurtransferase
MKKVYSIGLILLSFFTIVSCKSESTNASTSDSENALDEKNKITMISNEDIADLVKEKNAIIIDVRTPEEVKEGFIDGATLFLDYNGANFVNEIAKLDKTKTYIVYCKSGGRSAAASDFMANEGFENVNNLDGGIVNWTGKIIKK